MIKVKNKYNYPILIVQLLFLLFLFFFFVVVNTDEVKSGTMIAYMGILYLTILAFPIVLVVIVITNLICKKKYYTDMKCIAIPYIVIGILLLIFIIYKTIS